MSPPAPHPRVHDVSFPRVDTLLRVEEEGGRVVIRATRDTVSGERKARFIRGLAGWLFLRPTG